jgi:DNA-binding SARP family transcriptional activator
LARSRSWPAGGKSSSEEGTPETATKTVQVYVSRLRKALGGDAILTRGSGYSLEVGEDQLDAARFQQLAREGSEALRGGDARAAAKALREALALWRGPALADFAYESFAQNEIARLTEMRTAALEDRIDADLVLGRHIELVSELEALTATHPSRERLRGQLMLALYRSGRQTDALQSYREAQRVLVEELGL